MDKIVFFEIVLKNVVERFLELGGEMDDFKKKLLSTVYMKETIL
jgi:hypothetical protein